MAVGAPAISEPVAEGTLVYFWTRPLRRHALYLGRVMAAALVGGVMVLFSQTLVFAVVLFGWPEAISFDLVRLHVEMTMVVLLGTITYTALFAAFGSRLKKPLVAAILFTFGWEAGGGGHPPAHPGVDLAVPPLQPGALAGHRDRRRARVHPGLAQPGPATRAGAGVAVGGGAGGVLVVATAAGVFFLRMQQLDRQG